MDFNKKRVWYDDTATEAKFLMGGIGTGNFSIGSRGQLCDWEIFNSPNTGGKLSYTFFALRTQEKDCAPKVRVLESCIKQPYERSHGYGSWENAGIPHFQKARIAGEISKVYVELQDNEMPVEVHMSAFSPFIPLNADDSGIPAAVLRYTFKNTEKNTQHVSVAASMANPVGFQGDSQFGAQANAGKPVNQWRTEMEAKGIYMLNPSLSQEHLTNGSVALVTTADSRVTGKIYWAKSCFCNGAHDFWDDFKSDGYLQSPDPKNENDRNPDYGASQLKVGSVCVDFRLEPKEEKTVEFIFVWYFPNRPAEWNGHIFPSPKDHKIIKNYYACRFADAWEIIRYLNTNLLTLEQETEKFHNAFYQTTLPPVMLDAMAANITVLRSNTCFRIADGTFLGWEGTFDHMGCCEGNCSHVWNYEQTLAFLFPELEQNMRCTNFLLETSEDGEMSYRSNRVFGYERYTEIPPAADGQMGTIVQLYRDWKLSGDDQFLKKVWPKAVKALEYAFKKWDTDRDGMFESEQHNTYDIEFYGVSSMTNSIYYAALKAGEEIAEYLGEKERAKRYRTLRENGAKKMDRLLFNGEFYVQYLPEEDEHQYQYGHGCLSDQVLGQQLAFIAGLGEILPKEHVRKVLKSIFQYNFKETMENHLNVQRVFALNDEGGLINCTWPNGGKPTIPFVYSDEVWTGIEYQVASHMIYEDMFKEALTIVNAVRKRYDGKRRNPWNEVESGNHYVRSMSSWGLLIAASGYQYDMTKRQISFTPKTEDETFTCFFSTAKCWGLYHQAKNKDNGVMERNLEILYGNDDLKLI